MPTIGVDFKIRTINVDERVCKLQIWDTAGQERFKTITSSYYKGAHGIIVTYDITDRDSFSAVHTWMSEIEKYTQDNITRILVGNKTDLENKRVISFEEGQEMANHYGVRFLETSAKECKNVETAFTTMTREIKNNVAQTQPTRKALAGKANVHRAPANCGPTASGLKHLDVWLGAGKWDVIHFNFGIHDRATPAADYVKRLEEIVARLEKTGAKLIWASTTPIPDNPAQKQTAQSVVDKNALAAEVMKKHGIPTDDLFGAMTPRLKEFQPPLDVHYTGAGYDFLGAKVGESVLAVLAR